MTDKFDRQQPTCSCDDEKEKRFGPIHKAAADLEDSMRKLSKTVEDLKVLIKPVLSPASPATCNKAAAPEDAASDLRAYLVCMSRRADSITEEMQDLVMRIEL